MILKEIFDFTYSKFTTNKFQALSLRCQKQYKHYSTSGSFQISTSQPSISLLTKAKTAMVTHSTWSTSCLRPSPPLRQIPYNKEDGVRSPRLGRKPVRRKPGLWNLLIVFKNCFLSSFF